MCQAGVFVRNVVYKIHGASDPKELILSLRRLLYVNTKYTYIYPRLAIMIRNIIIITAITKKIEVF